MWLVFKEPRVNCFDIRPPRHLVPDVKKEKKEKVFELCRVWDTQQLLTLCPAELVPEDLRLASRVFNNFKNESTDRQIGDRRGQNFREGVLHGQSRQLPSGATLLQICPRRFKQMLIGAVTDRKDFYHQFSVSFERASTNYLYPFFRAGDFKDFTAYAALVEGWGKAQGRRTVRREDEGDFLAVDRPSLLLEEEMMIAPCFSSLFQGDHLGVEIATEAHSGLLLAHGLLSPHSRLQAGVCLQDDRCVQGLYIDDFFSISKEERSMWRSSDKRPLSSEAFCLAKEIYKKEGIIGSDDKDIYESNHFRVVGAEVDSRDDLVEGGLVACGLPAEKRLSLAMVAAMSAAMPMTSDALHSS